MCAENMCAENWRYYPDRYTTGMITQIISCDSGVNTTLEGWLNIAFYVPLGVMAFVGTFTLEK